MTNIDFSKIAATYYANSLVQRSAADILFGLLDIGEHDDILDPGCGTGNPTKKIREIRGGKIVGIDITDE